MAEPESGRTTRCRKDTIVELIALMTYAETHSRTAAGRSAISEMCEQMAEFLLTHTEWEVCRNHDELIEAALATGEVVETD